MTTTPDQGPSKPMSAREVVNRIAGFVITGWQSENQSKATVAAGKAYALVQAAIDAHVAAQLAAKDQQIAALTDECFNERHEAKALRGLLDNALADNKGKFHEGQSATDHGYVHVLAQKDAKIAALLADVACLAAEVKAARVLLFPGGAYFLARPDGRGGPDCEHYGEARAATDQRFPDGVPGAAR